MAWLVTIGLVNALLATVLALAAYAASRWSQRPALAHALWLLVLAKLVTPPLVEIPVGWRLDALAPESISASPAEQVTTAATVMLTAKERVAITCDPPVASTAATSVVAEASILTSAETIENFGCPEQPTAEPIASVGWWNSAQAAMGGLLSAEQAIRAACTVWLAGSALALGLFLWRAARFHWYLRRAGRADAALQDRVARLARSAELTSYPQVVVVDSVVSPMVWGLGRGVRLVFPSGLARQLERPACDALLLHELAHFARGDHWVRLLELIAHVAFWWHPVVWWARHAIEATEEECCDAWVVERQAGTRRNYADALLAAIDFLCDARAALPPAACGLGAASLLRVRLRQIMQGEVAARLSPAVRVGLLCVAALVLPLGPALFGASERTPLSTQPVQVAEVTIANDRSERAVAPGVRQAVATSRAANLAEAGAARLSDAIARRLAAMRPARPRGTIWATAQSPDGRYTLEWRSGNRVTLRTPTLSSLDLSAHAITCVAFSDDGRWFVTGHADSHVYVWDSETGGQIGRLRGSTAAVTSVAVHGTQVAAGSNDGAAVVWDIGSDVQTAQEIARLSPQSAAIACLRWSHAGDRLAVAVGDFTDHDRAALVVWTPHDGNHSEEMPLADPVAALAWNDDDRGLVLASWDGSAALFDASGRALGPRLVLAKDMVNAAAWSADCPLVAIPYE